MEQARLRGGIRVETVDLEPTQVMGLFEEVKGSLGKMYGVAEGLSIWCVKLEGGVFVDEGLKKRRAIVE